jgi:hypothetical protein
MGGYVDTLMDALYYDMLCSVAMRREGNEAELSRDWSILCMQRVVTARDGHRRSSQNGKIAVCGERGEVKK